MVRPSLQNLCTTIGLLATFTFCERTYAQLTVTQQTDLQAMAQELAGPGVQILNPVVQCHANGYGEFTYSGNALGATEGVLLTTGRINYAIGPNNVTNRSFEQNTPGDPLLNIVTSRTTYDACRLEFDIIPSGDTIQFDFVVGSEEYHEWVGSQYNDVFGFFISGPGITGDPGIGNEKNIALIPGTSNAVMINNVNNGSNQQFFQNNNGGSHIQYDGLTKGLTAISAVQPCQTYHLKLVVADASDRKFDTGAFIQKIESNAIGMQPITQLGIPQLVEGCNPGSVRFTRPNADPDPITIPYYIHGTAINGGDIAAIGDPDNAVAKYVTIPGGSTHADVAIDPIADGIAEGSEYLRFILGNPNCPTAISDTLDFTIVDELPASVTPGNTTICAGGSVQFTATGGATYSWSPANGSSATNIPDPIVTPAITTTYTATIAHGACVRTIQRTVNVVAPSLSAIVTQPLCNGQGNGAINLTVSGGSAPYTYNWTGPNGASFITEDLVNIGQGTYTVTVTDGSGCSKSQSFNVNMPATLTAATNAPVLTYGQNIACAGSSTGSIGLSISGGAAPYAVAWTGPNGFSSNSLNLTSIPAGTYNATITDQNGCTVQVSRTLTEPPPLAAGITDVDHIACNGSSTGAATATISGGMPPYTYAWNSSPIQNTATATNLSAGTRTVTITDGYGCQATASVAIAQPANALSVSIGNIVAVEQCQNDVEPHGSGTAIASGGTAPYGYAWNTMPVQTSATAGFNTGGDHTVVVTDANGCVATATANIPGSPITSLQIVQLDHVACFGTNTGGAEVIPTGSPITSIIWNNDPTLTSSTLTGVPSGSYTAIAQHANGCESTIDAGIMELTTSPLSAPVLLDAVAVTCFGSNNGGGTLSATGGTPPYTFHYNGAALSGSAISGLPAGTHMVTVTDQNGCTASGSIVIDGPMAPLAVSITSFTNELCSGGAQGTASALASGGTGPYTYEWDSTPAQTGTNASDLSQGTYTVTATDANGCTASANVSIEGPQFAINGMIEDYAHVTCFGANDGFATVSVWGGSNSFSVTWNTVPPQTGFTATGLAPGMYVAQVVDNNGCDVPKSIPIEIQGPVEILSHELDISNYNGFGIGCAGGGDGWIDVTVNGGYEPYNYAWRDEDDNVTGVEDLTALEAGTYYLNVIDGNGCTINDTIVLQAPAPIELQITPFTFPGGHHVSCTGTDDGSIDLSISGGIPPYSIVWYNNQGFHATSEDIELLGAGIYEVSVTDANGCTAGGSIQLQAPPPIEINAMLSMVNGYNISCAGGNDGTIDLTLTGGIAPFTFLWSNGDTAEDPEGLSEEIHEVIVMDVNGCMATATFELIAPEPLMVDPVATMASTSCTGSADGSITTTMDGGVAPYSIQWSGPNGFTSIDADIDQLIAGPYTISITDANGCTANSSIQIAEPMPLSITVSSATYNGGFNIRCHGESSASISTGITGGTPPYAALWTLPNGSTSADVDQIDLPAGEYELLVTDANGCTTTGTVVLTEPSPLSVIATASDMGFGVNVGCAGNDGSISLQVSGGTSDYAYDWTGPNGYGSTASDISGLVAGVYDLLITDANGCTVAESIELTAPSPIAAELMVTSNLCYGGSAGSIDADVNGGNGMLGLAWTGPYGFTSDQASIGPLPAGIYVLEVTDQLGCVASFSTQLEDPEPITSGTYVSFYGMYNLQCVGDSTGAIAFDPAGGTAPYQIQVSGPDGYNATASSLSGLVAGAYQVSITDQHGCSIDTTITLTQPLDTISATFNTSIHPSGDNVSCHGGNDGWIEANVSGGSGPYEIFWRGPDSLVWNMSDIYDLPAGDYSYELVVIDANQCSFNTLITLTQPDSSIEVSSQVSDHGGYQVSCPGATDGSIDLAITGGSGGYDIAWAGPGGAIGTQEDLTSIGSGTYMATITDINGCTVDHVVQVGAPPQLAIAFASMNVSCHGGADGILQADVTGGAGSLSHIWTGNGVQPDAGPELTGITAGEYCLSLTDQNGCNFQDCLVITEPSAISADAVVTDAPCGGSSGSIDITMLGGTGSYTINWNNGSTNEDLLNIASGTYGIEVTDENGCAFTASFTVGGAPAILASAVITDAACAGTSSGAIDLSIEGGTTPFSIQWNNGSSEEDLDHIPAGEHTVSISDAAGCTTVMAFEVAEMGPIQLDTTLSHHGNGYNISSFQGNDGTVLIEPSGGSAPYQISWSNGGSGVFQSSLAAGTYLIEVIDANGCTAGITIELTAPSDLEMPTGYSPNGDGANDVFHIRGLDAYPKNTFTVYNRWGNVVFDRPNYRNDWAGENSNGEMLADGTYFVILTVAGGERVLQGYVDMRR